MIRRRVRLPTMSSCFGSKQPRSGPGSFGPRRRHRRPHHQRFRAVCRRPSSLRRSKDYCPHRRPIESWPGQADLQDVPIEAAIDVYGVSNIFFGAMNAWGCSELGLGAGLGRPNCWAERRAGVDVDCHHQSIKKQEKKSGWRGIWPLVHCERSLTPKRHPITWASRANWPYPTVTHNIAGSGWCLPAHN